MRQNTLAANGSTARTISIHTSGDIRWRRVAAVLQFFAGFFGSLRLHQLRFIAGQYSRDYISRLVITWAVPRAAIQFSQSHATMAPFWSTPAR